MELLVVGLGNPGPRYVLTRHNAGFIFLDFLAEGFNFSFQQKASYEAEYGVCDLGEHKIHFLKPLTYMNLSGRSVAAFLRNSNLSVDQILAVHDEVEIPLGDVRLKKGGGDAGHNGLKSMRELLGSGEFYRMRVGVGRPAQANMDLAAYVLQKFSKEEQPVLVNVLNACDEALEIFLNDGLQKAQMRLSKI